ncbi:MAG: GNAT family N-acetyltransferase [Phycisphaerales bacterium]|nr:MAG: GNAT family N-acetyltransferase [Phycisphaerales bacterium]
MDVIEAHSERYIDDVRAIFLEYAEWLGFDLHFQDFERELARLPGEYSPPLGRLLLAAEGGQTVGCIALREFAPRVCEMKRLYIRPAFRGRGVGRLLAERIISEARAIGYERMRLDTVPAMSAAINLYESLGFKDIEPYRHNPIEGARFMEVVLTPGDA